MHLSRFAYSVQQVATILKTRTNIDTMHVLELELKLLELLTKTKTKTKITRVIVPKLELELKFLELLH